MNYKKLGNTDLDVSTICLGTMTWGEQNTQEEGFKQMNYALDQGVNFWDTAEIYSIPMREETYGETERIIGNWFEKTKKRDKVIIATKVCGNTSNKYIRGGGNNFGKNKISQALDESLKRLKTDYIDLYQLHWPERNTNFFGKHGYEHDENDKGWTPFEEILESLEKFINQGKIRYIGLSNETAWGTVQFANEAKKYNDFSIASIQNEYSLLCRLFDTDLAETCFHENVKLLAYSPLVGGMITGKYLNSQVPENSRLSRVPDMFGRVTPNSTRAIEEYIELSKSFELDPVHLALSFCRSRPFMGSVIFGASNVDQLKLILKGKDIYLKDDVLAEVNKLYKKIPMPM